MLHEDIRQISSLCLGFTLWGNAPINVNPVGRGEGGVRARGGDLTNFKMFWMKFPRVGNERSIKSVKKAPTPGEKSKQTIL